MGANCPSTEALRPDHGQENSRHTQPCRKKARKEVWKGKKRSACDKNRGKENQRNSENTESHEQRRRGVTFILEFRELEVGD
jgi:hypothetical protein